MEIKRLDIEKQIYGEHKDHFVATVTLKDDKSSFRIVLNPDFSECLLPLVIDKICDGVSEYTNDLHIRLKKSISDNKI